MMCLEVLNPGVLLTIQDRGRPGYAALGVGQSGAADRDSHDAANRLVGNSADAATVEITLGGAVFRVLGDVSLAVVGAMMPLTVNGKPRPTHSLLRVMAGDVLEFGYAETGLRSYLAVRGGVDVPPVLGSRSTDTLSGVGPEALTAGSRLARGSEFGDWPAVDFFPARAPEGVVTLRVSLGPRDDWFSSASTSALLEQLWTVTNDCDRVGVRVQGPGPLRRSHRGELPSEPMVVGAIQVPPSGDPIIFLTDHPVTGGYPVIAVVDEEDLPRAAQLRPGDNLRFRLG
ncbi:MAG: biotin-dependent carboxyltransferase family protein [Rhodococcus sp.]|nr:biotin-dependent carboxyltransferase family protein [Rhodococcus sp. (in: high G+C Gram-positive bacteria)]